MYIHTLTHYPFVLFVIDTVMRSRQELSASMCELLRHARLVPFIQFIYTNTLPPPLSVQPDSDRPAHPTSLTAQTNSHGVENHRNYPRI
jgi:hypothetical protein